MPQEDAACDNGFSVRIEGAVTIMDSHLIPEGLLPARARAFYISEQRHLKRPSDLQGLADPKGTASTERDSKTEAMVPFDYPWRE